MFGSPTKASKSIAASTQTLFRIDQISRQRQSKQHRHNRHQIHDKTRRLKLAFIQLRPCPPVSNQSRHHQQNARKNRTHPQPYRESRSPHIPALELCELSQRDGETSDGESKYDNRHTGTHPRQKRPFVSQVVAGSVGIFNHLGCARLVIMTTAALFHSLLHQRPSSRQILDKFRWNVVPRLQVLRTVVGHPHPSIFLFKQRLHRQIDGQARRSHHQRRTPFGAAKNQQFSRAHFEAYFFRLSAMIHARENLQSFLSKRRLQPLQRFLHRIAARHSHQSFFIPHFAPPEMVDARAKDALSSHPKIIFPKISFRILAATLAVIPLGSLTGLYSTKSAPTISPSIACR